MISYLHNSNWIDISREERLFCAHLYFDIKKDIKRFIEFLNKKNDSIKNDIDIEWEIAYEVCFYRDWLKSINQSIKDKPDYPQKELLICVYLVKIKLLLLKLKHNKFFKLYKMNHLKKI